MKISKITGLFVFIFLCFNLTAIAQLNTPRGSQQASVTQKIGLTSVTINYSRPSVKGREIWGKLVPYGMNNLGFGTATSAPWRAGADENTTISFSTDVTFEGKPLKSGTYGFHVIVEENNRATIILSFDSDSWGSFFYDQSRDALRAEVATRVVPHTELLTYEFGAVSPNAAEASLLWENKEIPFNIVVDVPKIVLAGMRDSFKGRAGFNRQNWENAANYSLNNGGDLNEALLWINNAIEGQFFSQKNANNLGIKAQILSKMGKTREAGMLLEVASKSANKNQLNAMGYQMLNAKDYQGAIKFFELNIERNPTDANGYDSLGEAYKLMGDKVNAIKHFKKALTLNPIPGVKASSEKHLKELEGM